MRLLLVLAAAATVQVLVVERSRAAQTPRYYQLLYQGVYMINSSYYHVGSVSRIGCAGACSQQGGCWVFTWDAVSWECELMEPLTDVVSLISAQSSINTYYVVGQGGFSGLRLLPNMTWPEANATCYGLEGRLILPPDYTYAVLLQDVFSVATYFVGIWRVMNDTSVWYDIQGNPLLVLPLKWQTTEPNNIQGIENLVISGNGMVSDVNKNIHFNGICQV